MTNELALLSRAPNLSVEAPDAGCCGMAGAFGYGKDRFELSRAIGERVLLPAINASPRLTLRLSPTASLAVRRFASSATAASRSISRRRLNAAADSASDLNL